MSDGYRVDLEHLDSVTARIAGLQGFVQDTLAGLDARMATAHQNWTGETADKHSQAHREWIKAADEVHEGIETMRAAAAAAHGHYSDALAANLRILRSGGGR
ncbi:WXG100 family type VII secretion target [Nocardia terpenica]|uniref:WXG100 family type VII secretion target n=1 Tax=Nocardia terpenica TaxID=455432 RepID=UPI002FDFF3D9